VRTDYLRLPIDADRGFPQAFRMAFNGNTYVVALYVTATDESVVATDQPLELPMDGAYLVLEVSEQDGTATRTVFRRKVVPNLEYEAGDLAMVFTRMSVHPLNLNGSGAFGSTVVGGVAPRWAS
jgi:hypothetical protein